MEEQIDRLVKKLQSKITNTDRLLVAVSGIPGSGKTTLAATVTSRLNADHAGSHPLAAFVPMDGYHLSRAQLSAMPDPVTAHARRGAEFTFDGPSFLSLAHAVRAQTPASETIFAPSFDHALKDPKENDIPISAAAKIVIFEGNYLSLNRGPWREAAALMDETWFVDVDLHIAEARLVRRHVQTGVTQTEDEARSRVRENDMPNGEEIIRERMKVDEVIVSREDDKWKPKAQGE